MLRSVLQKGFEIEKDRKEQKEEQRPWIHRLFLEQKAVQVGKANAPRHLFCADRMLVVLTTEKQDKWQQGSANDKL